MPDSPGSGVDKSISDRIHDVLVVGGGPAGSSCAFWLAEAGWDVVVVEKKHYPREKTCGDGLTPRSVRQLEDMGLSGALERAHRYEGLRTYDYGRTLEMRWPSHPSFPSHGYVVTRYDLDRLTAERAEKAGAAIWQGAEAMEPLLGEPVARTPQGSAGSGAERSGSVPMRLPACRGAVVLDRASGGRHEVLARYVVVADGSLSRFGRALGTRRNKDFPQGMALRGYFRSPRHDDPFIESHLDIRDASGTVIPGYGWIFPLGDGRVNAGVGVLTTSARWKGVNTTRLMEAFVDWAPRSWGLSQGSALGPPTGGRLPMGLAVGPRLGPNVLVAGDAAGTINPFNGEGIAYGYETGRLAAAALGNALSGDGHAALDDYERRLEEAYALYYKIGRAFVKLISRPSLMRATVGLGMHSKPLMEWVFRIMANLVRPDEIAPSELLYRSLVAIARHTPEP